MEENKFTCPFCGYEMEKKLSRCANCAGILDVKIDSEVVSGPDSEVNSVSDEVRDDNTEALNKENNKINYEEKIIEKAEDKKEESVENKRAESEKTTLDNKNYNAYYGNAFNYQPYNTDKNLNNLVPPVPKPLTNAVKVALTTVCVLIPVIGQFVGLILSIIFMNSDEELKDCDDRRSFGLALLIACVIAFIISIFGGFALLLFTASDTF